MRTFLVVIASFLIVLTGRKVVAQEKVTGTRVEIETTIEKSRPAHQSNPGNDDLRRKYASDLFKLGDIWKAGEIINPLASENPADERDLDLAARIAILQMDFDRSEELYRRLISVTKQGSDAQARAYRGLVMVYYQSQQFAKTKELAEADNFFEGKKRGVLLKFMQAFEGEPYQISWNNGSKFAKLGFTNDIHKPGALPEVKIKVNGHDVLLTLDTGGDRLYLDVSVAEKTGIRELVKSQASYAYTKGKLVDEPWGVADKVELDNVTIRNVPAVIAQWKANGPKTDGVIGTAILKQFLTTIDYETGEIILRPRGIDGIAEFRKSIGNQELVSVPFFMSATHLMFAKGSINGHKHLNMFIDSGLASSMPIVILDETVEMLELKKNDIPGTKYYWSPLKSHGLNGLELGPTQALGNVFVESDNYRNQGFFWDALISHQYLRRLGSWTIDFDSMKYYFPKPLKNN